MSLIVFAALGILVKKSFELVPTGMMNLRTLVGGRQSLRHHQLADDDQDGSDSEDNSQGDAARRERVRGASEASNEDATVDVGDIDREEASAEGDARALHIIREPSPHTF
ncbi:hypothetical protein GGI07_001419 [Coemansia sp. Benny D115]|nr:hypothetical protein GGI07_001419 [Coemansia sp. Benny D115]